MLAGGIMSYLVTQLVIILDIFFPHAHLKWAHFFRGGGWLDWIEFFWAWSVAYFLHSSSWQVRGIFYSFWSASWGSVLAPLRLVCQILSFLTLLNTGAALFLFFMSLAFGMILLLSPSILFRRKGAFFGASYPPFCPVSGPSPPSLCFSRLRSCVRTRSLSLSLPPPPPLSLTFSK